MKSSLLWNLPLGLAAAALISGTALAADRAKTPPDLTVDRSVDRKLTYNLGSTGLRGWIYTRAANNLDSQQGRTTTASRQILVTHVGDKSPADGVIQVNDVLLGAGGKPFTDDARKSIALAIQESEKTANGGVLKLTRWRDGKAEEVQLKLRVMGDYSATAPYDCPKSKRIFEEACRVLEKEPLQEDWAGAVNGLALLATGNPDYLPRVGAYARKIAPQTLKLELKDGMVVWDWGYRNVFLSEYYLLTGDKEVLHAIGEYTTTLARGQSLYGTFGHGLSERTADGQLHGSIKPYGPVNAAGLIGNLAIVLGAKCGIQHPEIQPAIERASKFFGYFVDKGAIPYGEHMPWPSHENNGKNAMAAMLFALQPDRSHEARFFAKMVTASYQNREYGHTGQGFSYLWGALGANVGGPDAAAAFFREASWHFDLVRRSDGSFTYDGDEQYGPGETSDNTYYGDSSYSGLSPAATYVLTYSLPLKRILLTGRDANQKYWLSRADVAEAVASGRFDLDRKNRSTDELLDALGNWSPVASSWAAEELASRTNRKDLVAPLIAMAEGPDARKRQGAAEALGYIKSPDALPVLVRLLTHEDRWLRVKAANALKRMGDTAKPAIPGMLKAVVTTAEPLQPIVWDDPIQLTHGELAAALFQGLLRNSIKGQDPELLYPAIRAIARNADGMARATLTRTLTEHLTLEDVRILAPDILEAVRTRCPADTMFGNEIRMAGFRALAKYQFKEAIEAGVLLAKTQGGHGSESRTGEIMKAILPYGTAARESIPALKELIGEFNAQCERGEFPGGSLNNRRVNAVKDAITTIEAATSQPEMRSVQAGKAPLQ
jgi:HEAT repeat protein